MSDPTKLGDDLALRHVRLGRLELNTVKDWVLYYDEKVADKAADPNASTAEKKVVSDAIARASFLVRHFAQIEKGLMDYGLDEDPIATEARKALASPACTPEQARELRKWLSAIMYYALDPDFAPPRAAGFAWGSANMMAQVQCRACHVAALLPNHPQGKSWRAQLAKFVTLYLKSQVNDAGATLECPHYGTMAIDMPAKALLALAGCGDVDLSQADQRMQAAAHMRLATLLPYDMRGGFRSCGAEGDGYYMPEEIFAAAGRLLPREKSASRARSGLGHQSDQPQPRPAGGFRLRCARRGIADGAQTRLGAFPRLRLRHAQRLPAPRRNVPAGLRGRLFLGARA